MQGKPKRSIRTGSYPLLALLFTLAACNSQPAPQIPALPSPQAANTAINTATLIPTATEAPTATATVAPTDTPVPTETIEPSPSPTPTASVPAGNVLMQAFCRYGPGKAYLYSHGLYEGDRVEIHGRNYSGNWLWVKPGNLDRHCWAAASVMEISGDASSAPIVQTRLPHSTLYGPPEEVQAVREGDEVTVSWSPVWMTEDDDRGYLIEANICQEGALIPVAVHSEQTSYTFRDDASCSGASGGKLYTVEKHGYTDPVTIPWP